MLVDNDVHQMVLDLVSSDRETLPMLLRRVGNMGREDEHMLFLGVLAHSRAVMGIIDGRHVNVC